MQQARSRPVIHQLMKEMKQQQPFSAAVHADTAQPVRPAAAKAAKALAVSEYTYNYAALHAQTVPLGASDLATGMAPTLTLKANRY